MEGIRYDQLWKKALNCACDLLCYLRDQGDRSEEQAEEVCELKPEKPLAQLTRVSEDAIREADYWYRQKQREWSEHDQLNRFGLLKVWPDHKVVRYSFSQVKRNFPWLHLYDQLALTMELDGDVTQEELMDVKENLRNVVDRMVEQRLSTLLQEISADLNREVLAPSTVSINRGREELRGPKVQHQRDISKRKPRKRCGECDKVMRKTKDGYVCKRGCPTKAPVTAAA